MCARCSLLCCMPPVVVLRSGRRWFLNAREIKYMLKSITGHTFLYIVYIMGVNHTNSIALDILPARVQNENKVVTLSTRIKSKYD